MTRKLFLPLTDATADAARMAPTVEAMRRKLGGRVPSRAGDAGRVVLLNATHAERFGVVLHAEADTVDVWLGDGLVKRMPREALGPDAREDASVPASLVALAAHVARFDGLREGERVAVDTGQGLREGLLLEKCRYGALVQPLEGSVVGVGFQRLWPLGGRPAPAAVN